MMTWQRHYWWRHKYRHPNMNLCGQNNFQCTPGVPIVQLRSNTSNNNGGWYPVVGNPGSAPTPDQWHLILLSLYLFFFYLSFPSLSSILFFSCLYLSLAFLSSLSFSLFFYLFLYLSLPLFLSLIFSLSLSLFFSLFYLFLSFPFVCALIRHTYRGHLEQRYAQLVRWRSSGRLNQSLSRVFISFHFISFYFILFYFILFYFILFYFILFYFILFYFIYYFNFNF